MNFGQLFQSAEDAVYEVMVWILLLPKTLFRTMVKPRQMMEYVAAEWEKKPEERFDEYLSPVLLWLIVLVAPLTLFAVVGDPENSKVAERLPEITLYSMIVPFTYIAWVEMANKEPVKRSTLKRAFYKHCYMLTPGLLIAVVLSLVALFFAPLALLALVAIPFYEAFVFEAELGISYKKAFAHALGPQVILVVVLVIVLGLGIV